MDRQTLQNASLARGAISKEANVLDQGRKFLRVLITLEGAKESVNVTKFPIQCLLVSLLGTFLHVLHLSF